MLGLFGLWYLLVYRFLLLTEVQLYVLMLLAGNLLGPKLETFCCSDAGRCERKQIAGWGQPPEISLHIPQVLRLPLELSAMLCSSAVVVKKLPASH